MTCMLLRLRTISLNTAGIIWVFVWNMRFLPNHPPPALNPDNRVSFARLVHVKQWVFPVLNVVVFVFKRIRETVDERVRKLPLFCRKISLLRLQFSLLWSRRSRVESVHFFCGRFMTTSSPLSLWLPAKHPPSLQKQAGDQHEQRHEQRCNTRQYCENSDLPDFQSGHSAKFWAANCSSNRVATILGKDLCVQRCIFSTFSLAWVGRETRIQCTQAAPPFCASALEAQVRNTV